MLTPIIAIIGKSNVGKSQLFNRIIQKKISIVDNVEGLTRDRIMSNFFWRSIKYQIIDTGGINFLKKNDIENNIYIQSLNAIKIADIIFFVTENAGYNDDDIKICNLLRKYKKKVILVINKTDNQQKSLETIYDFYKFGLGDPIPVSALHGYNIGDLLDLCHDYITTYKNELLNNHSIEEQFIKISLIGKPNVGKSSIVNYLCKENRVIVSKESGTTRDSIDIELNVNNNKYILIDTAGLRKQNKIDDFIEKYSRLRTHTSIKRSDICLIIIDAESGITEQDTKIAGLAHEENKGCIIVVNKFDLITDNQRNDCIQDIKMKLAYINYAPIIFTSVITKVGFSELFPLITKVYNNITLRITTSQLNNILHSAVMHIQPPTIKGKRLKLYYITQASVNPIVFILFCNSKKLLHFSYLRYVENHIRKTYDLIGTPIIFKIKESHTNKYA